MQESNILQEDFMVLLYMQAQAMGHILILTEMEILNVILKIVKVEMELIL